MKVLTVCKSDSSGGASIAAYRLHKSLIKIGVSSKMLVDHKSKKDIKVIGPVKKFDKFMVRFKPFLVSKLNKIIFKTKNSIIHSPAIFPSRLLKYINNSDADIVHLHWVQGEMLSVKDIGSIKKPLIWTLHDCWPFCGAEHYYQNSRWIEGYNKNIKPKNEKGFDLNLWTWSRKIKYWKNPIQIITPSYWLAEKARKSFLMKNWPIKVIPNPIDVNYWKNLNQKLLREKFGLSNKSNLLLFGTYNANQDPRKGNDLLVLAIKALLKDFNIKNLELILMGNRVDNSLKNLGIPIHYLGLQDNQSDLRKLYNIVDAVLVPSRQENLPNIAIEAMACSTPVISFNIGGLPEIIKHKKTGYLAKAFNTHDFAKGIKWILKNKNKKKIKTMTRKSVLEKYSDRLIASNYKEIYKRILI